MSKLIRRLRAQYVQIFLISFFIPFLIAGCRPDNSSPVSIIWQNNKAIGLSVSKSLVEENEFDHLQVRLVKPGERIAVLGNFNIDKGQIEFESIVPLTRGLRYEVLLDNSLIAEIEVPFDESVIAPAIRSVYPTQDTVPENLLKVFIRFTQPMVEGQSLEYITVLKGDRDTLKGTFLDLEPELWNTESTVLTLWLDPGRIKRDLIPNKELGTPLHAHEQYTLHISKDWKSKEGKSLTASYVKSFVTTNRDDESPSPDNWMIIEPSSGTKQPVQIQLKESLDYSLLNDAIRLADSEQKFITGTIELMQEEQLFQFTPNENWKAGYYTLIIDGRLEDLAGNNLNRPFDKDLKSKEKQKPYKEIFEKKFEIQ